MAVLLRNLFDRLRQVRLNEAALLEALMCRFGELLLVQRVIHYVSTLPIHTLPVTMSDTVSIVEPSLTPRVYRRSGLSINCVLSCLFG